MNKNLSSLRTKGKSSAVPPQFTKIGALNPDWTLHQVQW